jgi:hypothetical protein
MKTPTKKVVLSLVAICSLSLLFGGLWVVAGPLDEGQTKKDEVMFGFPSNGLSVGVYLKRPQITLGEDFDLCVVFKNTSESTIAFSDARGREYRVVIFDDNGHCIASPAEKKPDGPHWDSISIRTWELKAGESKTVLIPVGRLVPIVKAGVYHVLFMRP